MAQTVGAVVDRAKRILQERGTGIRWTDEELLGWLNEAYVAVAIQRPDAHSVVTMHGLEEGAKQSLPAGGLRLMDVIADAQGRAIRQTTRRTLATMRPDWQAETPGERFEFYLVDERLPTHFWLYPPAQQGVEVELAYVATPPLHATDSLSAVAGDALSVSDRYTTPLLDFMLYRAFAKDAETPANLSRSQAHFQAFQIGMQGKGQGDVLTSPDGGGNDAG